MSLRPPPPACPKCGADDGFVRSLPRFEEIGRTLGQSLGDSRAVMGRLRWECRICEYVTYTPTRDQERLAEAIAVA